MNRKISYKKYEEKLRNSQASIYEATIPPYQNDVESIALLQHLPKKCKVILDIGCGTGRFIPLILSHLRSNDTDQGEIFVGVDISLQSLLIAQRKLTFSKKPTLTHLFIQGSATEMPFKANSFDLIICSEMFEHILDEKDQLKVLREFRSILKPGGRLILSTYNYSLWDILKKVPKVWNKFSGDKPNYIRLTRSELIYRIRNVFNQNEIKKCFGTLCLWSIPPKLLNPLYTYFGSLIRGIERIIEKTFLSSLFGHLLIVVIDKRSE